jgi:hypothetical protein
MTVCHRLILQRDLTTSCFAPCTLIVAHPVLRAKKVGRQTSVSFEKFDVLSRAINFGCQCHFKIWLHCQKFKKFPCLIMPMSTNCKKNEKKMTINVIQHDDRL